MLRGRCLTLLVVYVLLHGVVYAYAQWPSVSVEWNGTAAVIYVSQLPVFKPNSTIVMAYYVNESILRLTWECLVSPCSAVQVTVSCGGGQAYAVTLGQSPSIDPYTHTLYETHDILCPGNATLSVEAGGRTYTVVVSPFAETARRPVEWAMYMLAGLVMMLAYVKDKRQFALGLLVFSIVANIIAMTVGVADPARVYTAAVVAGVMAAVFLII